MRTALEIVAGIAAGSIAGLIVVAIVDAILLTDEEIEKDFDKWNR